LYQSYLGWDGLEEENVAKFKNWVLINTFAIDLAIIQYYLLYKRLISDFIWLPTTLPRFALFFLSLPIFIVYSYSWAVLRDFTGLVEPINSFRLIFLLNALFNSLYGTVIAITAVKIMNGPLAFSLRKRTIMWIYGLSLSLTITYFGIDATVSSYEANVVTSSWCAVVTVYTIAAMIVLITSMEDIDIQEVWLFF